MKKLLYLILCALVNVLAGCNLYMDEEDIQNENTSNGDGFSAPRTYVDSISTVTYQFNEGTVYLDEKYRPYIFSVNTDTVQHGVEIRLAKSIPANLMPSRGNYLASGLCDVFESGLCHQVDVIEQADGFYVVKGHMVSFNDVFKTLQIQSDYYVASDTVEVRGNVDAPYIIGKAIPVKQNLSRVIINEPFNIDLINVPLNIAGYLNDNDHLKEYIIEDLFEISKGPLSDNSKIKLSGEFDGYLGAEYVLQLRMSIFIDTSRGIYDVHAYLHHDFFAGILIQRAKATLSIPVFGCTTNTHKTPVTGEAVKFNPFDYIRRGKEIRVPPITTPIGPVVFYVTPTFTLDLYAEYNSDEPIGMYYKVDKDLTEFGFHREPNQKYSYPRDEKSSRGAFDYLDNFDFPGPDQLLDYKNLGLKETGFNFTGYNNKSKYTIGTALNIGLEMGLELDGVLNIFLGANAAYDVAFNHDISSKYKANVSIVDQETGEKEDMEYANNITFESGLYLTPSFGGKLDYYIDEYELFSLSQDEPIPLIQNSTMFLPEMETTVELNENLTTNDEVWFYAKVKTKRKSFVINPQSVPKLAIYRVYKPKDWTKEYYWTFVKSVDPINGGDEYSKNTVYEYDFDVPLIGSLIDTRTDYTYIAVPYFESIGGKNYSNATSFKVNGVWGVIQNAEQVRVNNGTVGNSQIYGFKFDVTANSTMMVDGWVAKIYINDAVTSEYIASKTFDLGKLKNSDTQKYMMFFNGKTDKYYDISIYLEFKSLGFEDDENTWADSEHISIQPAGGTVEIDYSKLNSSIGLSEFRDYQILE